MIRKNNILVSAASLAILLSSSQMYAMDGQRDSLQPQERGKKKSTYQVAKGIAKIIVGSGLIAGAVYRGYQGIIVAADDNLNPRDPRYFGRLAKSPKDIFKHCLKVLNPKISLDFNYRYDPQILIPLPIITGIISLWSGINNLMKK